MRKKVCRMIALTMAVLMILNGQHSVVFATATDRDNSIRSVHVSNSEISNATLVIGSYLIDLNGLSDDIYSQAQESASEFGQNEMYYKSELAEGQWFEITDATSIADITDSGTPVNASVIEALEFTHKVAADGTVTDLRTNASVSAYDIPDPYDLANMVELDPIKLRYQYLQAKETKTDSDEKYLQILDIFYDLSIQDATTADCDNSLRTLSTYQSGLSGRGKPASWNKAVDTVMSQVDAQRRVARF